MNKPLPGLYLDRLLRHEGGYVFDPKDKGGETKYGISKRAFPDLDIASLTEAAAGKIYEEKYWQPLVTALPGLPNQVLYVLLDFSVNSGYTQAIKSLQRAIGVGIDGKVGAATRAAAAAVRPTELINAVTEERLKFIRNLVVSGKLDKRFEKGILNRVHEVRKEALQ